MRIQNKLFGYIAAFSFALVVISLGLVQLALDRGMIDYVNARHIDSIIPIVKDLEGVYQVDESWDGLRRNHRVFKQILDANILQSDVFPRPERGKRMPPPPRDRFERDGPSPPRNGHPRKPPPRAEHAVLDVKRNIVVGRLAPKRDYLFVDIKHNNEVVGYFATAKRERLTEGYDLSFVDQQQFYLLWLGGGLILLVAVITLPLSRHLTRPIRDITAAMHNLAQGHYDTSLKMQRNDELGGLSRDVNELALTLKHNQDSRQKWLAEVSHELRTPLAVLKGELESILDGIRPLTMDQVQSLSDEVKQLQRLIDDLHDLARTDMGTQHYKKQKIDIVNCVCDCAKRHIKALEKVGIELKIKRPNSAVFFYADAQRIQQLIDNLFSNIIKYAKQAEVVTLSIQQQADEVLITIEDNGLGVAESDLALLFNHQFRVHHEASQWEDGSGIGLSICKKITEAHNGKIHAFRSTQGGLGISMKFTNRNVVK